MAEVKTIDYIKNVLNNVPNDWINLTTHRLDIYNEELAKSEFLDGFEKLYDEGLSSEEALGNLPTAYDYIRLGHPLSSVLEWTISRILGIEASRVISFSSISAAVIAILRTNSLRGVATRIIYSSDDVPTYLNSSLLRSVYGYSYELVHADKFVDQNFEGITVRINDTENVCHFEDVHSADFTINYSLGYGSIVVINKEGNFVSEIQHYRRRETIAMTPANTLLALARLVGSTMDNPNYNDSENKQAVQNEIKRITESDTPAIIGSSGLSIQYAIVMGLIDDAKANHPNKRIKIIVPPNCYGGTNDQARRVAVCDDQIEVVDLPVDRGQDMVQSIETVLEQIAKEDAVPYIIAEIPTNPRVEVPDLNKLRDVLSLERTTNDGNEAVAPVFILDQTFCPNVHFLGENEILAPVKTIAYVSGSKFPSGGKCTAGYCVANKKAAYLMEKIEAHIQLCDNEATSLQMSLLAEQMPSMLNRIKGAYNYTRDFVNYIQETLPGAKINFVSDELAAQGFTPSVFSLDLPTKGANDEEREAYKRELNLKLINRMIGEIPNESKFCVSYGQLKGCYWTIPATSTQGTTKEGDKDYIVRVALSSNMDLERHKKVFADFVDSIE